MSKFVGASGFVAGFAARHDTAAQLLAHAFAPPMGFAAADIRDRVAAAPRRATGFAPQGATPTPMSAPSAPPTGPKHFSPADKDSNPTEGWDPLDPASETESFLDPLAAAHAAGYAEGLAAAAAVAQGNAARDQALLASLAAALATDRLDRDRVATQLRQTVLLLVGKLVGEIGISPELLAGRIESATELLADSAEAALLRLHPDDVALIEGTLPKSIFAAGDPNVARGSFVLESASTIVEDGPAMWLDQLASAIDRVAVPAKAA
jgi:flagellar assembly protein FliH